MMKLQILGSGCPKCRQLAENAEKAAGELGVEYTIEKVTDINDILDFGVMMTPALAINGEIKIVGRLADVDEIMELIDEGKER